MLELCYYILNTFSQNPLLDVRQVYKLHTDSVWYDYSSEREVGIEFYRFAMKLGYWPQLIDLANMETADR